MVHDITVCFAGFYCRLFFYLVEVRKRVGGMYELPVGADESTGKKVSARTKVSAVVGANSRGVCSGPLWFKDGPS